MHCQKTISLAICIGSSYVPTGLKLNRTHGLSLYGGSIGTSTTMHEKKEKRKENNAHYMFTNFSEHIVLRGFR